jgi:putative tricarboxylic transport membrane protein
LKSKARFLKRSYVSKVNADVNIAISLLVFCAIAFYITTSFRSVPAMLSQNVPPTFFPRLVIATIATLSVMLAASNLMQQPEPKPKISAKIFITAFIFIITSAVVQFLGMITAVFLLAITLPLYWGERQLTRIAFLAIGLPIAIHVIFVIALDMRLPMGVFR